MDVLEPPSIILNAIFIIDSILVPQPTDFTIFQELPTWSGVFLSCGACWTITVWFHPSPRNRQELKRKVMELTPTPTVKGIYFTSDMMEYVLIKEWRHNIDDLLWYV